MDTPELKQETSGLEQKTQQLKQETSGLKQRTPRFKKTKKVRKCPIKLRHQVIILKSVNCLLKIVNFCFPPPYITQFKPVL